jgi:hypothetical protein
MSNNISSDLAGAITELCELLSHLNAKELNTVPFEGSWTAGRLAKHLLKSYNGVLEMVKGETGLTERQPDEYVNRIKADFLDLNTKMPSPDFLVPPDITYDKEALLTSLSHTRAKLVNAINTLDATATCLMMPFPVYGYLTRLELYYFMLYHTQRHLHQFRRILEVVKK